MIGFARQETHDSHTRAMTHHQHPLDPDHSIAPEPLFRIAAEDDWPQIWPVFRAVVATGDTYMFEPSIREDRAKAAWMLAGVERSRTYIAKMCGEVVATAILRPNQPGLGDHVANAAWMVHPQAAGKGIGRKFADYVMNEARTLGYEAMQFNAVVESNTRAVRLWESMGFRTVGKVPAAFRTAQDTRESVLVMYKSLRESLP